MAEHHRLSAMGYVTNITQHEFSLYKSSGVVLGQIDIELTERCNNNCVHCCINLPGEDAVAEAREMETVFVRELLRQAAELGCLTVRFTGGEPTVRNDFAELYLYARRLGMRVILFTNARGITPEIAALLAKYPPGHAVEVSVYGMSAETYDQTVCCSGAYEEFRRGVGLLAGHDIPYIVKGTKMLVLRKEQEAFEAWAVTIPAMRNQQPDYSMNFDLRVRRDSPEKNRIITRLRATPEESLSIMKSQPNHLEQLAQYCSQFIGPSGDKLFTCGAGLGICVDAYGKAQVCLPLRHPDFCVDLHEVTLKRVLTELFPVMREVRATNPEYLRRCARCFLKGFCKQCPAKSWAEYGTLDTPVEYLCDIAHVKARYLGLLSENEYGWEVADWKDRVARFVETHWKKT